MTAPESYCGWCDGPGVVLGDLGSRTWYRCRNCGAEWSEGPYVADAEPLRGPLDGPRDRETLSHHYRGLAADNPTLR